MFLMLIILIYCAGRAGVPRGDFQDTDSEYLANEDYNTVNSSNYKDNNIIRKLNQDS